MGSILLATDGSEYARQAAKQAIELAADRGVPLHVICAVDQRRFDDTALSSAELATIYAADHAAICIEEVAEMAATEDVRVVGDTRHGSPHDVILEYADEVDAEIIVVGEHGDHTEHFSGVRRKLLEESDREVRIVEGTGGKITEESG
ncbi:universal stress protein [Natrinema sp. HArc-T2]|uniref:universal stress protein n=1 Tax=Natrinema sp. HArc-T2 TaxID=3242701 RepID=UPI00359D703A